MLRLSWCSTTARYMPHFDFVVAADGLYPFTIIYQEGGHPAALVLSSENLSDGTRTLLNDTGGVSAFYPLVWRSATSAAGPYTVDAVANANNSIMTSNVLCDGSGDPLNQVVTGGTVTGPGWQRGDVLSAGRAATQQDHEY